MYCYVTGDDDTLMKLARVAKLEDSPALRFEYDVLYRRKQFDQALVAVRAGRWAEWIRLIYEAIVCATLGQTDHADRLFQDFFQDHHRGKRGGAGFSLLPAFVQLLGPEARTDSRQLARDIQQQSSHLIPNWRDGWYHDMLKFNAGQMEVAELEAKAGASRFNQCEAYFYIGLRKLSEKKRTEAKQWFTRSFETGVFHYFEYRWSRAFLANIDDPKWLPWCAENK